MSEESNKPPKSFLWTAGIALVWNLMGFGAYVAQVTLTPEALAQMPEAEGALYENMPGWATGAFAFAVTAGVIGCLLLTARKGLALPVLTFSLACVLVQNFNSFVLMDVLSVVGPAGAAVSVAVIIIGVYLVWFANNAKRKGWIS